MRHREGERRLSPRPAVSRESFFIVAGASDIAISGVVAELVVIDAESGVGGLWRASRRRFRLNVAWFGWSSLRCRPDAALVVVVESAEFLVLESSAYGVDLLCIVLKRARDFTRVFEDGVDRSGLVRVARFPVLVEVSVGHFGCVLECEAVNALLEHALHVGRHLAD